MLDLTAEGAQPIYVGGGGDPLLFRGKNLDGRINGAWRSIYPDATLPKWSPDGQWVAYRRMDGGSVQVWRSSADGDVQEQLTASSADVENFYWSKDGQEIWYETTATTEEQETYLRPKWEKGIWAGDDSYRPISATYALRPLEITGGQRRVWVQNLSSRQARLASDREGQNYLGLNSESSSPLSNRVDRTTPWPGRSISSSRGVTASGGRLASYDRKRQAWLKSPVVAAPRNAVQLRIGTSDVASSELICELTECIGFIHKLWWSRNGREVLFRLTGQGPDRGHSLIYAWSIYENEVRTVYADNSRHLSACSSTGYSLVCFSDEPARPRTLVEVNYADGSVTELFDPNPQFDEILLGDAEWIEWENEYGAKTNGWLVRPVEYEPGKRYPLVIVQYNAKFCFNGGTGAEYPSQLFAAKGFIVLCTTFPPTLEPAEILNPTELAEWQDGYNFFLSRRQYASSLVSAVDLLKEKGLIDPDRVGVTGLSAGAEAMQYALVHTNKFNAAIGATLGQSPVTYYFVTAQTRATLRRIGYGRSGTNDDRFTSEMSPGMNTSQIHTPILIQASDDEAIGSMFNFVSLQEEGKPVDKYVFQDEYHVKWHPQNRRASAVRSVDWMRFWLKGEIDTDPEKTEQFERWRDLCKQHITNLQGSDDPELRRRGQNQPCEQTLY